MMKAGAQTRNVLPLTLTASVDFLYTQYVQNDQSVPLFDGKESPRETANETNTILKYTIEKD